MPDLEIPDDELAPEGPAPVATVRRRGENFEQLQMRQAGYSDRQTGYNGTGRQFSGGGSPLERSARLAMQRERLAMQAQAADERAQIAERRASVVEQQYQLQQMKQDLLNQDKLRADSDTVNFLKATRDLDPNDPDFDGKLVDAQTSFPYAAKDEFVQRRMNHLTERRQIIQKTTEEATKFRRAKELAAGGGLELDKVTEGGVTFSKPPKVDEPKTTITTSEESLSTAPNEKLTRRTTTTAGPASQVQVTNDAAQPDTFEKFQGELKAMVDSYGGKEKVPAARWAEFEARKARIGKPSAAPAASFKVTPGMQDDIKANAESTRVLKEEPDSKAAWEKWAAMPDETRIPLVKEYNKQFKDVDPHGASFPRWLRDVKGLGPKQAGIRTPQTGKEFLSGLGITPKQPKLKVIPGTGGAIEG